MASCMVEHGLTGPVLGVTFDGTGYGTDGLIWGGEFLAGDYRTFRHAAHLRLVGLPGGERAVREPWRVALAHLRDTHVGPDLLKARVLPVELRTVERMLERSLNTPLTSSAGRLFDAGTAYRWGLVNQLVGKGRWLTEAVELARTVAARAPLASRLAKQAVLAAEEGALGEGLIRERELFERAMATADRVEGMRAFLEKREPDFKGR